MIKLSKNTFISKHSVITGNVELGENVSVWPMCVLRGDADRIVIGGNSNVQDGSVIHPNVKKPVTVGKNVTIGHKAIVHACTIGDNCLIGMGSVILDGAIIEDNCIIAAGSVVPPGKIMPSGKLVMGSPAKPVRDLTEKDFEHIKHNALEYVELAQKTKEAKIDFI
ncbi:MAG: gamma carbonic anhydrase family protein [Endomicrobia bacterium]|nr:gamma carbonic anhydrase family protein [Endomicrobiia bacterium]